MNQPLHYQCNGKLNLTKVFVSGYLMFGFDTGLKGNFMWLTRIGGAVAERSSPIFPKYFSSF